MKRLASVQDLRIVSGIICPSGHTSLLILSADPDVLAANQPLRIVTWVGYRDTVPVYLSSLVHDSPRQFAEEVLATHNQFFGYKLRPKAEDFRQDVEAHALKRQQAQISC